MIYQNKSFLPGILLCVFGLIPNTYAQISISKVTEMTNVLTPRVVGVHTVVEIPDMKLVKFQELIVIDIGVDYAILNVSINDSKDAPVDPEEVTPKRQYVISKPGTYRIDILGIDFKKELYAQKRGTFTISEILGPTKEEELEGTAKEVQVATKNFMLRMSKDFETTSTTTATQQAQAKTTNGPYPTVAQSSASHNVLDQATRSEYKTELGRIMAPLLGTAAMPESAPKVFKDISIGIKGAVNGR